MVTIQRYCRVLSDMGRPSQSGYSISAAEGVVTGPLMAYLQGGCIFGALILSYCTALRTAMKRQDALRGRMALPIHIGPPGQQRQQQSHDPPGQHVGEVMDAQINATTAD